MSSILGCSAARTNASSIAATVSSLAFLCSEARATRESDDHVSPQYSTLEIGTCRVLKVYLSLERNFK